MHDRSPLIGDYDAPMRTELVVGADIAAALDEWEAIYAMDPMATPFVSPAWARAWLRCWSRRTQPWLVLARDGSRLAGVAALTMSQYGPLRVLGTLGQEPGDYWDVVAAPADRAAVTEAIADDLVRRRREWDAAVLTCLAPDATIADALASAGLKIMHRAGIRCPAIALPDTWEEYLAGLPAKHRNNLRRHIRRLDEGRVELRECATALSSDGCCRSGRSFASASGTARTGSSTRPTEWTASASSCSRSCWRSSRRDRRFVWEFRVDGHVAGVYVNFVDDTSFYWYLGGFDRRLRRSASARSRSRRSSARASSAAWRATTSRAGAEPFKYWFGASDRLAVSLVIGSSRPMSRAALTGARIVNGYRGRRTARASTRAASGARDDA